MPIGANNFHNSKFNESNKSQKLDNSLKTNGKNNLRNNINITNNSLVDDHRLSFNKNMKNSKIKENDSNDIIIIREDSKKNLNTKIPGEKINSISLKNNFNSSNNNNINNLKTSNTSQGNLVLKVESNAAYKNKILGKKLSENIIKINTGHISNINKIEKMQRLELKDLDSLDIKSDGTNSAKKDILQNNNICESSKNKFSKEKLSNSKFTNNKNITSTNTTNLNNNTSSNLNNYSSPANIAEDSRENAIHIPASYDSNNLGNVDDPKYSNSIKNNTSDFHHTSKNSIEMTKKTDLLNNFNKNKISKDNNPNLNKQLEEEEEEKYTIKAAYKNKLNDSLEKAPVNNKNIKSEKREVNSKINIPDPQIPYEYLKDIHNTLSYEEILVPTLFGYMKSQTEINEQMRAILVDWIIEIHARFNLKEETLFLCVNLIDRFLKTEAIQKNKLQLLGVSSIMIACKQEEIYSPSIKDFLFITDNAYSKNEIFEMEYRILKNLEFNIVFPSSLRFYELISLDFNFTDKQYHFGLYLLELYLIDYRMTKFLPSVIACTAAYIVMKFFKLPNYTRIYTNWNKNTNSSSLIKDCAREICFLVDNINGSSLKATKKKFSQEKYAKVSLINFV